MKTRFLFASALVVVVACKKAEPVKESPKPVEATATVKTAPAVAMAPAPAAKAAPGVDEAKAKLEEISNASTEELSALIDPTSGFGFANLSQKAATVETLCTAKQHDGLRKQLVADNTALKLSFAANGVTCASVTGAYVRCDAATKTGPQLTYIFEVALENAMLVGLVRYDQATRRAGLAKDDPTIAKLLTPQECTSDNPGGPH